MSKVKRTAIRAARKSAHISNKILHKTLHLTARIENKATRILDGTDYSFLVETTAPLEKIYYNSLKYITPVNPALPMVGQEASVVLLIPTLDDKSFYGGTATALIVAGRAAVLQKKPLRIVQTLKTGNAENMSGFFRGVGVELNESDITVMSVADRAYNIYGYLPMHPDDVYVASAWWDAYLLGQLPLTKKFIYLVQDFEPIFYNNSDLYVLAESTYKMNNFVPLCNTKLMYDFMRGRSYPAFMTNAAQWFEPAVSRLASGAKMQKKKDEKRRLFLYGRPDVHRNLFFTALNAIDYSVKADFLDPNEWEFFMAGQDSLPDIKLTSGAVITNLGKMKMEDYVAFSKTIDLAVSPMMAPHPNYPTLEFASIGTQVVTTRYANKTDLSNYSAHIFMSDTDAESMAGAINAAILVAPKTVSTSIPSTVPESWEETLSASLSACLKAL
ncbi:MAG: hypothetical protein WC498_03905 [Candidatus Saccharimonadales bacterium]